MRVSLKLTIRNLFIIILFCGIFYLSMKPIVDPDFWWHLRTGQLIDQTRLIPVIDPFSFTAAGKDWLAHEWLSEIFIYNFYEYGGFGLLIFIFSLVITIAYLLSYLRCPAGSKPYIAGFAVLLGAIASAPIWGVRPQMFNLLFTSAFLFLLDGYQRSGSLKWIVSIPLITMLWVNMHAGYILGIAVEMIYVVGFFLEIIIRKYVKKETIENSTQKSFWLLICVLIASLLAVLVNPAGFEIIAYPFQTLTDSAMQTYIGEWFSPDFHQVIWQPLAFLFLMLIGAGMSSPRRISVTKILLTAVFGYGALRSIRNIPLFAIVVIPVLAEQLNGLFEIKPGSQKHSSFFRIAASILLIGSASVLVFGFNQATKNQQRTEAETFPKDAVAWIEKNKPEGNLFNSYNWGGYILWRLYPEYLVYIDGRADLYGKDFITNYTDIYFAKSGWEEKLEQDHIEHVFVESDSMLADAISQSSLWELSYQDKISVIFSRK